MKIVQINGGLGNQMFQYAFYLAMLYRGEAVKADISEYARYNQHNGYELEKIFGIKMDIADWKESLSCGAPRKDFIHRMLRKLGLKRPGERYIHLDGAGAVSYQPDLLDRLPDSCYLEGYWQSEKWFDSVREEVRHSFRFSETGLDDTNRKLLEQIGKANSVAVHVRRGDYTHIPLYQNICTLDGYYKPAIDFIKEREEDLLFFVFSNDIPWCRENLELKHAVYVDHNSGPSSYRDMHLMSSCKHNIIANSTFSWWGAWLNDNPHKIVLTPSRFLNTGAEEDIIPQSWIRIGRIGGAENG